MAFTAHFPSACAAAAPTGAGTAAAQTAGIVMETDALELHRDAVQEEALVGIERSVRMPRAWRLRPSPPSRRPRGCAACTASAVRDQSRGGRPVIFWTITVLVPFATLARFGPGRRPFRPGPRSPIPESHFAVAPVLFSIVVSICTTGESAFTFAW